MTVMQIGEGILAERFLDGGGRILCPSDLVPAPGQYLLAFADNSDSLIATPVFLSETARGGFLAAPALPTAWLPATPLRLRGPLGHGFSIPPTARRVVLIAFDDNPERLRGLIAPALAQDGAVVLVCESIVTNLPESVEVQPLAALRDVLAWADYAAFDVSREYLPVLDAAVREAGALAIREEVEVLVRTAMPCGALAECGVCPVTVPSGWRLACKDGPVFNLKDLF